VYSQDIGKLVKFLLWCIMYVCGFKSANLMPEASGHKILCANCSFLFGRPKYLAQVDHSTLTTSSSDFSQLIESVISRSLFICVPRSDTISGVLIMARGLSIGASFQKWPFISPTALLCLCEEICRMIISGLGSAGTWTLRLRRDDEPLHFCCLDRKSFEACVRAVRGGGGLVQPMAGLWALGQGRRVCIS
jgi:hypothetical protein